LAASDAVPICGDARSSVMKTLSGTEVRTRFSNYSFKNREEAEAFFIASRDLAPRQVTARPAESPQRKPSR
jgi:hypothetical protein